MPARGLVHTRSDAAFSMVEIIVVMVIMAVLGGVGATMLQSASKGQSAPMTAATGGVVWRGIEAWRMEEGAGLLPTANRLTAGNGHGGYAGGLVDGAGSLLIPAWPEASKGAPVKVHAGSSAVPPTTSTTWANDLVYFASADRRTGWLAAYGSSGALVFRRSITAGATPGAPIG